MIEDKIKQIEEEIYEDLSPIKKAAQRLNKKLPLDGRTLSDEAWHFFHFETKDYATMKRTIELSCKMHQWSTPALISMEDLLSRIVSKESLGKKVPNLTLEMVQKGITNLEEIIENKPVFVYVSYMDIRNDNALMKSDNSLSKMSENISYFQIMKYFILYCSQKRNAQNSEQIRKQSTFLDFTESPYYNRLFFVSYGSLCTLPDNLKNSLYTIDYSSLTADDFKCLLWEYHLRRETWLQKKREDKKLPKKEPKDLVLSDQLLQWYVDSMSGLEEIDVRRLLSSMDGEFASNYVDYTEQNIIEKVIVDYKNEILKQHGRLEVRRVEENHQVDGLDTIQKWLDTHKKAIKSYKSSLTGILLVGIPGTGKSATAKETAKRLGFTTLVRLDMSRILGGRVGDSETGMREMLQDLQFVAPCVLWIDEIEKAMSGANGNGSEGGSSTITRLFGMLLTFIQENDRPVFIVATANDISNLPDEFFRNGRFDQTFCLMMPNYVSCRRIMEAKLNECEWRWKHKFSLSEAGLIFDQCVGTPEAPRFLTGADIEAHVTELFHVCESENVTEYSITFIEEQMKKIVKELRVQATPSAPHTMKDIAKRYLDMMQRGFQMAGEQESPYKGDKLCLNNIRYYCFEQDTKKELPFCIQEPEIFQQYKEVNAISEKDRKSPSCWYDARFFYELNKAMCEVVFFNKEDTLPEVRSEYLNLMRHIWNKKMITEANKNLN